MQYIKVHVIIKVHTSKLFMLNGKYQMNTLIRFIKNYIYAP